jgi:hypothetical protein
METIPTRLDPRDFNKDEGHNLSRCWYPVSDAINQYRDAPLTRQEEAKRTHAFARDLPIGYTVLNGKMVS